jgi:hypothetical protein
MGVFVLLREPEAPPLRRRRLPGCHLPKLGVIAQLSQTEPYALLHCAERQAEALGYLRVPKVGEVGELKDLVLRVREDQEGFLRPSPSVLAPGLGEGFARLSHWGLGLLLRPPMGRLRAQPVYALIADHG